MSKPEPCITKVTISTAPKRKRPKAGDEKVVKGVTLVRQHKRMPQGCFHAGAYLMSNGRPVWEWVEKGSDQDRTTRRSTHE